MAAFYKTATVNYDGDGQLKLAIVNGSKDITLSSANGEWTITKDNMSGGSANGVIYAPETDNYAAAVLEFTV